MPPVQLSHECTADGLSGVQVGGYCCELLLCLMEPLDGFAGLP